MTPYQKRVKAAQGTHDRYKDRPWQPGRYDCAQMTKTHLVLMGQPIKAAAKAGTYRSIRGGIRWLKKLGYDSLIDLMDDHFERIPPAAALPGDVVAIPGEEGPGALTIAMTNGRVLGYNQDAIGAAVLHPLQFVAAWRIPVS